MLTFQIISYCYLPLHFTIIGFCEISLNADGSGFSHRFLMVLVPDTDCLWSWFLTLIADGPDFSH